MRSDQSQTDLTDIQSLDWLPEADRKEVVDRGEKPLVYFSKLKPDIIVHEYSDRFELYRVEGNKVVQIGTEYR